MISCVANTKYLLMNSDAEIEPIVTGYIEFAGEIMKISYATDAEGVFERIKATDKA